MDVLVMDRYIAVRPDGRPSADMADEVETAYNGLMPYQIGREHGD